MTHLQWRRNAEHETGILPSSSVETGIACALLDCVAASVSRGDGGGRDCVWLRDKTIPAATNNFPLVPNSRRKYQLTSESGLSVCGCPSEKSWLRSARAHCGMSGSGGRRWVVVVVVGGGGSTVQRVRACGPRAEVDPCHSGSNHHAPCAARARDVENQCAKPSGVKLSL